MKVSLAKLLSNMQLEPILLGAAITTEIGAVVGAHISYAVVPLAVSTTTWMVLVGALLGMCIGGLVMFGLTILRSYVTSKEVVS